MSVIHILAIFDPKISSIDEDKDLRSYQHRRANMCDAIGSLLGWMTARAVDRHVMQLKPQILTILAELS